MGRTAPAEIRRHEKSRAAERTHSLWPHRSAASARLFHFARRAIFVDGAARRTNPAGRNYLVPPQHVAGHLLALVVGLRHSHHSYASAESHPRTSGNDHGSDFGGGGGFQDALIVMLGFGDYVVGAEFLLGVESRGVAHFAAAI